MTDKTQKTKWRWRLTYPEANGHRKRVLYDTEADAFTAAAFYADSRVDKLLFVARMETMYELWRMGERLGSARYTSRQQAVEACGGYFNAEVRETQVELWRRVDQRDFHKVVLQEEARTRKATRGKQRLVR